MDDSVRDQMFRGNEDGWVLDEDSEFEFLGAVFERVAEGAPEEAVRYVRNYVIDNDIDSSVERVKGFGEELIEILSSIQEELSKDPDALFDELEEPAPSMAFQFRDWRIPYLLNKFFLRDPAMELLARLQEKDWRKAIRTIRELLKETKKTVEGGVNEIMDDLQP